MTFTTKEMANHSRILPGESMDRVSPGLHTVHSLKSQTRKWLTFLYKLSEGQRGCPFLLGLLDVFLWLDWGCLFFDKNFKEWSCVLLNASHQKVLLEKCNINVFKIITGPKCEDLKHHWSHTVHCQFIWYLGWLSANWLSELALSRRKAIKAHIRKGTSR